MMADSSTFAGAAPANPKVDDQPASDAGVAPALGGKQEQNHHATGAPAIVSPPATEPDHAGVDEHDDGAPPPSSQVLRSEPMAVDGAPAPTEPFTGGVFVPIPVIAEPSDSPATAEPPVSPKEAAAPVSSATIPKPVTVEDASHEEASQHATIPLGTVVPVPTTSPPGSPKTGEKRKVDDATDVNPNGVGGGVDANSDETLPDAEPAAKKAKTDGGAPQTGRRPSRSMSDKRKKEQAPVGQTHRKTRSQGPVEKVSL